MTVQHLLRTACLSLLGATIGSAASIAILEQRAFLHDADGLVAELDTSSPTYASTLNAENLGAYGWDYVNAGTRSRSNVRLLVFLDADLDRIQNTFVNEYGSFVSLDMPPAAPPGAIAASAWEIDEPGYVFGDVYQNLLSGSLDNTNSLPFGNADDVSLALGFDIGLLNPGDRVRTTLFISSANIEGLRQADLASDASFNWNGYAQITRRGPVSEVPEPSATVLILAAMFLGWRSRQRTHSV